jgi:hypothetical protein
MPWDTLYAVQIANIVLIHFSPFSIEQIPLLTLQVLFLTDEDILLYIYSERGGGGQCSNRCIFTSLQVFLLSEGNLDAKYYTCKNSGRLFFTFA